MLINVNEWIWMNKWVIVMIECMNVNKCHWMKEWKMNKLEWVNNFEPMNEWMY